MIRKRATGPQKREGKDTSDDGALDRDRKESTVALKQYAMLCLLVVVVGTCFFLRRGHHNDSSMISMKQSPLVISSNGLHEQIHRKDQPFDHASFENCIVTSTPRPNESNMTAVKPLFVPQFPDSIHDNLLKSIVHGITGLSAGAKSYYAQNKQVRRCFGAASPTAACLLVHPLIPLDPPPDDPKFTSKFAFQVVYALRSPTMSLALHQNYKDIKYRQHVGQSLEDSWRRMRDKHYINMFQNWKTQLMAWRNLTQYTISLYLPLEQLMDHPAGPELLIHLAALFRSQNLVTVNDSEMPCVWYQSIGKEQLDRYQKYRYDFEDYLPGYTQAQVDYIAQGLGELADQVQDDVQLVAILREYRASVLSETKIDQASVN